MRNLIKSRNGITLIALVITMIILIILAGIAIAALTGDNGIIDKSMESKDQTEIATVIEYAKSDIFAELAKAEGEGITETTLKTVLSKYFIDVPDTFPEDLSATDIKLTASSEYGGHKNIPLIEIYNGTILESTEGD